MDNNEMNNSENVNETATANENNTNSGYPQYPQYQQPVQPTYQPEVEEPVSMLDWLGTLLLINLVPCVGLIVCIVWAFSKDTKKSKANFCKAYLIFWLAGIALAIIGFFLIGGIIFASMSEIMQYGSYGSYGW